MANAGRIFAGIATLGASEAIAQPLAKAREEADKSIRNIKKRKIEDLDLGQGAGTERIAGAGQAISGVPQAKVTTTGYAKPQAAASYIQGLQKQLGLKGPQSTIDATRTAAEQALDREAYMASLSDAQKLAQQGQSTGARSQALSALRGTELAGQKAQLEAQLQGQEAQQLQDYERMLLGAAQQQGGALTSAEQQRAQALTQGSQFNAQQQARRELAQAEMALTSGQALNAEEYQRRMAEYQNALDKIQQANTADILSLQESQGRRSNITQGITAGIGGATRIAGAAI